MEREPNPTLTGRLPGPCAFPNATPAENAARATHREVESPPLPTGPLLLVEPSRLLPLLPPPDSTARWDVIGSLSGCRVTVGCRHDSMTAEHAWSQHDTM